MSRDPGLGGSQRHRNIREAEGLEGGEGERHQVGLERQEGPSTAEGFTTEPKGHGRP